MKDILNLVVARAAQTIRVFGATLQEIFDEAAYARFLNRTRMASSARSYAAFRRELEQSKVRRPKCC